MSTLIRARLDDHTREYFENLRQKYGTIPENHAQAIALRMAFF